VPLKGHALCNLSTTMYIPLTHSLGIEHRGSRLLLEPMYHKVILSHGEIYVHVLTALELAQSQRLTEDRKKVERAN